MFDLDLNVSAPPELSRGPSGEFRAVFRSGSLRVAVSMPPRMWRQSTIAALDLYDAEMSAPARNVRRMRLPE